MSSPLGLLGIQATRQTAQHGLDQQSAQEMLISPERVSFTVEEHDLLRQSDEINRKASAANTIRDKASPEPHNYGNPWSPGFWATLPRGGITALLLIVALTGAVVAILLASQKRSIEQWHTSGFALRPQVYISIISTAMDCLTSFALFEGMVLTFWRSVGQGSTLLELYHIYESASLMGAFRTLLRGGRNRVGFAYLLAAASTFRGPLLQRASILGNGTTSGVISLRMADWIPSGFVEDQDGIYSSEFEQVRAGYIDGSAMPFDHKPCGSECSAILGGFGFHINCSDEKPVQMGRPGLNESVVVFSTYADRRLETNSIVISMAFKNETGCQESVPIYQVNCTLRQARYKYNIKFQDQNILQVPKSEESSKFLDYISGNQSNELKAWSDFINYEFYDEVNFFYNKNGPSFSPYSLLDSSLWKKLGNGIAESNGTSQINCNTTFSNPTEYLSNHMRDIAFRSAVAAGQLNNSEDLYGGILDNGNLPLHWTQIVPYNGTVIETIYIVHKQYMIPAVVISLASVVSIAFLYCCWWELGRKFSLNPLEVAKAFDAPILAMVDGNATSKSIAKESGHHRVRYGTVHDGENRMPRLKVALEDSVVPVQKGDTFAL